jgi:hypothetical protein
MSIIKELGGTCCRLLDVGNTSPYRAGGRSLTVQKEGISREDFGDSSTMRPGVKTFCLILKGLGINAGYFDRVFRAMV